MIGAYVFLFFLLVVVAAIAFFWKFLPETRGRTFDDIARDLAVGAETPPPPAEQGQSVELNPLIERKGLDAKGGEKSIAKGGEKSVAKGGEKALGGQEDAKPSAKVANNAEADNKEDNQLLLNSVKS